ncbi:hypothetical protein V7295_17365 [Bacillus toyonensis]|uniref:hypothetical protein n=1 Tax=Bacillus cereus group TaxID=86661 RepID=UPI00065BD010|nr:hypothetical protein [Bacillus cereus]KMP39469.1 hypothetical protein TU54_09335 [Bacillus cereus]MED2878923.1 hypothetical protein [Bacillus thuringiensis]
MAKFKITFKQGESFTGLVVEDNLTKQEVENFIIENITKYNVVSFPLRGGATEIVPVERITGVVVHEDIYRGNYVGLQAIKFHN